MLRYIFLSLFALLLLTACGGSDTDSSSNDSGNVFENTTGARIHSKQDVVKLDTGPINKEVGPIGQAGINPKEVENNVDKLIETNSCPVCDLSGANLVRATLQVANLNGANLTRANLW